MMSEIIKIIKCNKTCFACPAQWDMWDIDGTYYYVRFRFGYLIVEKDTVFGDLVLGIQTDDDWNGFMENEEMVSILSKKFDFSDCIFDDQEIEQKDGE